MSDYTKQLPSGRYVAKRGYRYFLYANLEDVQFDDYQVSENLNRLNQGFRDWCYNRCEDGIWLGMASKLCEIKELDHFYELDKHTTYKYVLYVAEVPNADADIYVGEFDSSEEAWAHFATMGMDHACVVECTEL